MGRALASIDGIYDEHGVGRRIAVPLAPTHGFSLKRCCSIDRHEEIRQRIQKSLIPYRKRPES
jgi:hypothetical protein